MKITRKIYSISPSYWILKDVSKHSGWVLDNIKFKSDNFSFRFDPYPTLTILLNNVEYHFGFEFGVFGLEAYLVWRLGVEKEEVVMKALKTYSKVAPRIAREILESKVKNHECKDINIELDEALKKIIEHFDIANVR